jgi:hypothetical protein
MSRQLGYLLLALIVLSSCSAGTVDSQKALAFGDLFMNDVINNRPDDIYTKMEPEFYDFVTKDGFRDGWRSLYEEVGKPEAFKLASYGVGIRTITSGPHAGQTKPTCEIIYHVTTTKGVYPFKVKVVNIEGGLAATSATFELPN